MIITWTPITIERNEGYEPSYWEDIYFESEQKHSRTYELTETKTNIIIRHFKIFVVFLYPTAFQTDNFLSVS